MTEYVPTWVTVHPDHWPKQELHGHQTCRQCDRELAVPGVLCTNMRGAWEHLDCAVQAWHAAWAGNGSTEPEVRGRQRDLIDALHADPSRRLVAGYDPERGRTERYSWRHV